MASRLPAESGDSIDDGGRLLFDVSAVTPSRSLMTLSYCASVIRGICVVGAIPFTQAMTFDWPTTALDVPPSASPEAPPVPFPLPEPPGMPVPVPLSRRSPVPVEPPEPLVAWPDIAPVQAARLATSSPTRPIPVPDSVV